MKDIVKQLREILDEYGVELTDEVKKSIVDTANNTVKQLKATSPKSKKAGKHYANGWSVNTADVNWKGIEVTIYNKTKPQLTHLLNNGHVKQNGGRVAGDGHIDDADTFATNLLVSEIEKKLQ